MKHLIWIVILCLAAAGPASAAELGVKMGGGVVVDPSRWGGHVSFEVPLSREFPTFIAPFFELYRKGGVNQMPLGATLMYKSMFSGYGGTVYFGVGGGILKVSGTITDPLTGIGASGSSTDAMITAGGGVYFYLKEPAALFVQMRWFRPFAETSAKNELAFQAGLHFRIGEE